jgi:hypothetical protein
VHNNLTWYQSSSTTNIQSMASSSSVPAIPASQSIPVFEKMTQDNYRLWRAEVLLVICMAQLEGFIDGSERVPERNVEVKKDSRKLTIPNPDYSTWCMRDLHVLTYLVTSLSREVLVGVASNTMAADMWAAISMCLSFQSHSHVLHIQNQLVVTQKGEQTITTYFSAMRGYVDEMAAARKPLDDDDIMSNILNGLDADYNSLIELVNGMTAPISPETLLTLARH